MINLAHAGRHQSIQLGKEMHAIAAKRAAKKGGADPKTIQGRQNSPAASRIQLRPGVSLSGVCCLLRERDLRPAALDSNPLRLGVSSIPMESPNSVPHPAPEAEEVYRRWIQFLDDEFIRHSSPERRSEIVRDQLHQLYLGRPHGGKPA